MKVIVACDGRELAAFLEALARAVPPRDADLLFAHVLDSSFEEGCAYDPPLSTCRLVGSSCVAGATTGGEVVHVPQRTVCRHYQGSQVLATAFGKALDPAALAHWLSVGLVALPASLLAGLLALRRSLGAWRRRRFLVDHHTWHYEYAQWENQYFCHRCDCVFAPSEPRLPAD